MHALDEGRPDLNVVPGLLQNIVEQLIERLSLQVEPLAQGVFEQRVGGRHTNRRGHATEQTPYAHRNPCRLNYLSEEETAPNVRGEETHGDFFGLAGLCWSKRLWR